MRFKLTLAYDGSEFNGWQRQPYHPSVQEAIEEALANVFGHPVSIVGAGRTDTGVHAYSQVCHLDVDTDIPGQNLHYHITRYLPESIQIRASERVGDDFHARFSALSKTYRYIIHNGPEMHPIYRKYRAHIDYTLDLDAMRRAGQALVGDHDYRSFMGPRTGDVNTLRSIDAVSIDRQEDQVILTFKAQSFLRNQVRIMAGTLVEIGRGRLDSAAMEGIIKARDRRAAGPTLSPFGLYLMEIDYPDACAESDRKEKH